MYAIRSYYEEYVALPLKEGWHDVEVEYVPSGNGDLSILLGGAQVAAPLTGRH